jgi:hypothetical protein
MSKMIKIAAAASLLAVAGCTTGYRANVARFQQLPPPSGETFVVEALDPKLQGGIEFGQYAAQIGQRLAAEGYQPASSRQNATLRVLVDYDVDTGRERVRSTGFGAGAGFGYWGPRRAYRYGFYDPFAFGPGFNDVSSYTLYTSELEMQIERSADGTRLFEGRARARSRTDDLRYHVPNLIDAMFAGFPGRSGETIDITLPPQPRSAAR